MRYVSLFVFALLNALCAADLNRPIAELRLKDGRNLKNVTMVSSASSSVMAKWDGGRGTIPVTSLPDEFAKIVPKPPESRRERIAQVLATVPKLDMTPLAMGSREFGNKIDIAGQCLVTTKDGNSIILRGIDVGVYSEKEFSDYVTHVEQRRGPRVEAVGKASRTLEDLEFFEDARALLKMSSSESRSVWQILPRPGATGKTDVFGRFSFSHGIKPPFVVFATGERSVGKDTEYFIWIVKSADIANPQQIVLSNDGLWNR